MPVYAEDVYCGEYNGKPAYVDINSIEKSSSRTGMWEITNHGIYPEYSDSYSANINADGLWYKVLFNIKTQTSYSAWILNKNKKNTGTPINTVNFDFAYQTIHVSYPEANRRSEAAARKKLEEIDRQRIEDAKRNYTTETIADEGISIPYEYQTKEQLIASLTDAITKYVQTYNAAPDPKNITNEMSAAAIKVKTICKFFTKDELIAYSGDNIELQKALLSFK